MKPFRIDTGARPKVVGLIVALFSVAAFAQADPDDPVRVAPDVGPVTSAASGDPANVGKQTVRATQKLGSVALPQVQTRPLPAITSGPTDSNKKPIRIRDG